jgi:L-amino acid N-acyltransferase YncA
MKTFIYDIIQKAYRKFSRWVTLRLDYIYRIDLSKPLIHWEPRIPVAVSAATIQDVASAAEREYHETKIDKRRLFKSKIENGHHCFVAKDGSSVVGYNWIGSGSFWNGIDFVVLKDDEVWCSDAYTAIEWRGKGIHTALLAAMIEWARKENFRTAYTHVSAFHPKSWKAHEHLKWQVSGLYFGFHLPVLDKQWTFAVYGSRYPIQRTAFRSRKKLQSPASVTEQ